MLVIVMGFKSYMILQFSDSIMTNYPLKYRIWIFISPRVCAVCYFVFDLASTNYILQPLDPFLGGGTTAIACMNLRRKSIGIDINPKALEATKAKDKFIHLGPSTIVPTFIP